MDAIVEQQIRRELAMTNIVVESKIKREYSNYFVKWYGKSYIGKTKDDVLKQIPKIKDLKKILKKERA
tara:strand:+ start:232 stop:435 length:204 start_codon:yes stop_codon:yes gene_type:complete